MNNSFVDSIHSGLRDCSNTRHARWKPVRFREPMTTKPARSALKLFSAVSFLVTFHFSSQKYANASAVLLERSPSQSFPILTVFTASYFWTTQKLSLPLFLYLSCHPHQPPIDLPDRSFIMLHTLVRRIPLRVIRKSLLSTISFKLSSLLQNSYVLKTIHFLPTVVRITRSFIYPSSPHIKMLSFDLSQPPNESGTFALPIIFHHQTCPLQHFLFVLSPYQVCCFHLIFTATA